MNIEDRMSIPCTRHQTGPPGVGTELGRRAGRRLQPASAPCAAPRRATVAAQLSKLTLAGQPR